MKSTFALPRSVKIIRWIARIWSIIVTASVLLMFFGSHSGPSEAIPPVDMLLLSLTAVAILGLFIAWRWELVGGLFTIAMMFIREIAWVILKGQWLVAFLILWVLIVPPAILFLIAWSLERKSRRNSFNTDG
jgi:hypothetical protein